MPYLRQYETKIRDPPDGDRFFSIQNYSVPLYDVLLTTRKKSVDPSTAKELALKNAIKQLETQFGKGSVMKLGSKEKLDIPVISTGSLTLDRALGIGGLPRGRIVEIYGPESSGKTTLALHAVAQLQKTGGTCTFIDAGG